MMTISIAKIEPFVCGGISACIASTCIHPIDLAKVRLQLWRDNKKPSFVSILSTMAKNEGFFSLYAGLSASILRQGFYYL